MSDEPKPPTTRSRGGHAGLARTLRATARDAMWLLLWERRWRAGEPCVGVDCKRAERIESELRKLAGGER